MTLQPAMFALDSKHHVFLAHVADLRQPGLGGEPVCHREPDVPPYHLRGSVREIKPHWGDLVDAVPQLRLVGLAPGECGEVGQQLKDLSAGWGRRPWRLQLGVPSQLGRRWRRDEAMQGTGGQPATGMQGHIGVRETLVGARG